MVCFWFVFAWNWNLPACFWVLVAWIVWLVLVNFDLGVCLVLV